MGVTAWIKKIKTLNDEHVKPIANQVGEKNLQQVMMELLGHVTPEPNKRKIKKKWKKGLLVCYGELKKKKDVQLNLTWVIKLDLHLERKKKTHNNQLECVSYIRNKETKHLQVELQDEHKVDILQHKVVHKAASLPATSIA